MWFLFVCPGMMLVRFFRLHQSVVEWMLALALSFAFDAIVASILLYAGMWSTTRILDIVLGFSTGGAIVQLVTTRVTSLPVAQQPSIIRPWKLEALLPVFLATLLIGLTIVASIWSPPYGQQTLGLGSFLHHLIIRLC